MRSFIEYTNRKSGETTTYYVERLLFFTASVCIISSLFFSVIDLTVAIFFFLMGAFLIWEAIDVKDGPHE